MITARCFTNLDEWGRATWPTLFVAVPRVGDWVEGRMGDKRPRLRVVAVTHGSTPAAAGGVTERPFVNVELHR